MYNRAEVSLIALRIQMKKTQRETYHFISDLPALILLQAELLCDQRTSDHTRSHTDQGAANEVKMFGDYILFWDSL